jgi:spore coat protein JB
MNERTQLLREFGAMSFAAFDIHLFLDTHPFNTEALTAFNHYCRTSNVLKDEYEAKYGPLTACSADDANSWEWVEGPWPWENKGGY